MKEVIKMCEVCKRIEQYVESELDRIAMTGEYPLNGVDYLLKISKMFQRSTPEATKQ